MQTSHIQLAGGNSLSRFLTNRLINQARIRGITYSGEIRPTAMTRTVLSDLNKLSDSGLIFQNGPLDLSMILICFQHRYQTEADSLGRGLFLGNGDQRRTILEDIVKFGQQGITDCVSAIDIELAQLNDFYSRPVLITTGGTINMAGATGRKAAGVVEKLTKERFLSSLIYGQQIKALPEQPDSSNIGPNDWKLIFDAVVRVYSQKMSAYDTLVRNGYVIGKPGGIMITHGTDTLEETACILAFELARRNIPMAVVMTGSHSPADQPNSDAESNLLRAALIANNPNTPAGVYVVIGNKVHLGARVKKVFTIPTQESNWSYFSSLGAHIGYFPESGGVVFDTNYVNWRNGVLPKKKIILKGGSSGEYGYVDHILMDAESSPSILAIAVKNLIEQKALGRRVALVIQGDFSANPEKDKIHNLLGRLLDEEILVYTGSPKTYNVYRSSGIRIIPIFMVFSKVRTKLAWLLRYFTPQEADALLGKNIAGEEPFKFEFPEHLKYETYPSNNFKDRAVLVAYPDMSPSMIKMTADALLAEKTKRPQMVIYGFGDGHLPVGYNSIYGAVSSFVNGSSDYLYGDLQAALQKRHYFDDGRAVLNLFQSGEGTPSILDVFLGELIHNRALTERLLKNYALDKRQVKSELASSRIRNKKDITPEERNAILAEIQGMDEDSLRQAILSDEALLREFAKRIIADILGKMSPMLYAVGNAVDRGIEVFIRTKAFRSKSNLEEYELGQMLLAMGAYGDDKKRFKKNLFTRSRLI